MRLNLNTTKTVCSVFHSTSRFANYEISITNMTERFPFDKTPKYLSVTLDCTISYHQHLFNIEVKVTKYCHLLKRLSSSNYGGEFTTSSTSELPFYFSLAEYCCPIWSQSHHCKKVDSPLNKSLR